MNALKPLFCKACSRKIGEATGIYRIAIQCRRCKHLNQFQAA
ncbi:hypothetical protein [Wielerella bovis]|nr:hypothetical protein [Wielerella bovis]